MERREWSTYDVSSNFRSSLSTLMEEDRTRSAMTRMDDNMWKTFRLPHSPYDVPLMMPINSPVKTTWRFTMSPNNIHRRRRRGRRPNKYTSRRQKHRGRGARHLKKKWTRHDSFIIIKYDKLKFIDADPNMKPYS